MYVRLDILILGVLAVLGIVSLILLIMLLIKMYKVFSRLNILLTNNDKNINETLTLLPRITSNISDFSDDLKNVGDTIAETSTSAMETKDNIEEYIAIAKDVFLIAKQVFSK